MLSAAALTVVNGDLCCGSCGRARAGGAALSTTAARTDRHPSCRAPGRVHAAAAACANWTGRLGRRSARRAIPGRAHACARACSQPVRPVRRGHQRRPRGGCAGCTQRIGTKRHPTCAEPSIRACPARLPSGKGSRFGTGMGAGQRSGRSGGAHPAGQPVAVTSSSWLRRTQQANIGVDLRAARARPVERSRAPTGRPEPKSLTSQRAAAAQVIK